MQASGKDSGVFKIYMKNVFKYSLGFVCHSGNSIMIIEVFKKIIFKIKRRLMK